MKSRVTCPRLPETDTFHRRLSGPDYTPAFDLDGALSVARAISGRTDAGAHLEAV